MSDSSSHRAVPCERVRRLRSDLFHCMIDGLLYCLMVGLGESFIPAFVMELGLGPVAAGLVITLPVVVGAWAQLFTQGILRRCGSYVRFVWVTAFLQGLMYLPLGAIALGWKPLSDALRGNEWALTPIVFTVVALYWIFGLMGAPGWMTMCGKIIPARVRGGYFGRRLRYLQAATLAGLLAHGWLMTLLGDEHTARLRAFAALFAVAALARAGSAWHLSRYSEPAVPPAEDAPVDLTRFLDKLRTGRDGRFVMYAVGAWFATQIAQPFLNPFMLDRLKLTPLIYSVMLAAWYFGKGIAQPWMGRYSSRHGSLRPLALAAAGLVPLSLFWLFTSDTAALALCQLLSGVIWGMFDLGIFLQTYESTNTRDRTMILSCYSAMNESAKAGGSILGGGLLDAMGRGAGAYAWVFSLSALARALSLLLLVRLRHTRPHAPEPPRA